jgi:uncharacterized protein YndB with AHSA1/START domain
MKTILHVIDVKAPRSKVLEALTTIDGLAGWWTTNVTGSAAKGGRIAFVFDGFGPTMEVTELDAPTRVSWKCIEGVEQWADNTFQFDLAEAEGATRLRFRQNYATELGDDEYGMYNFNWGYYLHSLKMLCETGSGKPSTSGRR